jgi:hypothetical protein
MARPVRTRRWQEVVAIEGAAMTNERKWVSPRVWLAHYLEKPEHDRDDLVQLAQQLADSLDGSDIEELFHDEMEEDGYYAPLCANCKEPVSECEDCYAEHCKCSECPEEDDTDRTCNGCGDICGPGTMSSDGYCDGCVLAADEDEDDDE